MLKPLGEGQSPSFEETWIPFLQGWFTQILVKISPVALEKMFLNDTTPLFEQTWIPFTQG
jgi:hypothetical protein